jgi:hypothetical protein
MTPFVKLLISLSLIIIPLFSVQAQDCTCEDSFENAVDAYEKNYSLFMYKVTDENRDLYQAHTDLMRTKVKQTDDLQDCKILLEQWLDFFRDGHTYITMGDMQNSEIYNERIKITEKQFKADYQKKSYQLNPLLGIWRRGSYTVAIMPNPAGNTRERDFVGVILESGNRNWKRGEVKFELTAKFGKPYQLNYLMADHSVQKYTGQQLENAVFEIAQTGEWVKLWPEVENTRKRSEIDLKYDKFHITYVDEIPYLRLPDFYSVDPSYLDSLMNAHHDNILKSDFMVVDVRGNSGGDDGTYFPVLPYVLSGPVELPSDGFWLSEYNTEILVNAMAEYKGYSLEEYAEQEKQEYEMFTLNKGTAYFKGEGKDTWVFNADTLFKGPKKVIILTDGETASSGETFVYRTNQSDRVVVYGQNTAGVVDGFNIAPKDIGCFQVYFPTSYRAPDIKGNPIDPYGIAPDVYVDEKVDVLAYAIEHMKQLIKNEDE